MERAKALTGDRIGEWVRANESKLTYDLCRTWKLYCPTCYQPVHLRKSRKIKSYFAHYDFENKNCPERSDTTNKPNSRSTTESREQDLAEVELFIEQLFYGINLEYFQNPKSEISRVSSQELDKSIAWFISHLNTSLKKWISHYCSNNSFLNWKDSAKEVAYLMDCLHILIERPNILRDVVNYSASLAADSEFNAQLSQPKFGLLDAEVQEENLASLILLDLLIERLYNMARNGVEAKAIKSNIVREFINIKIPENTKKTAFRGKLLYSLAVNSFAILIREETVRKPSEIIRFKLGLKNRFWYGSPQDDSIESNNYQNASSSISSTTEAASESSSLHRKGQGFSKERKPFDSLDEMFLELYINQDGDLAVRGYTEKKYSNQILGGITKILFNRTAYSMLVLLGKGFISEDIAEKAAQLSLQNEYGNLTGPQALEKFRFLHGYK